MAGGTASRSHTSMRSRRRFGLLLTASLVGCVWPLARRSAFSVLGQQPLHGKPAIDPSRVASIPEMSAQPEADVATARGGIYAASLLLLLPTAATAAWQLSTSLRPALCAGGQSSIVPRTRHVRKATDPERYSSVFLLKEEYSKELTELRSACGDLLDETHDDIWLIRFLLEKKGDVAEAKANIQVVLKWRAGEGKPIVDAAAAAVAEAQADGGWNNAPVLAAAPNIGKIGKYITDECLIVLSTSKGDLISMIRASVIPSKEMMEEVSVDELVDFFIYAREVNSIIAAQRSKESTRLCRLVAANDLTGVSSFPDKAFQEALTGASAKAVELYPGLAGPTVLLNLPFLARAVIGLLLPLFPGAVKEKVKFATFGMDYMVELTDVLKEPKKSTFLNDFEKVLKS
mmetsp:Transcript_25578/g.59087  ORF Transcript_25578/g.59087 Transcript_25578/m.59087 type:complete len:402 (+) Transcript_25578:53-1258(+)